MAGYGYGRGFGARGRRRPSGGTPTPTPAPVITLSTDNWRIPILAVADSASDAVLVTALQGAHTSKYLARVVAGAGATRTLAVSVGAITAPGGFAYFSANTSANPYPISVEQSFNSTNGVDGTWAAVSFNLMRGSGDTTNRPQCVDLAAGPARWIRLTWGTTTSLALEQFGLFQWPSAGLAQAFVLVGASHAFGRSASYMTAIKDGIAGADPVFFDYAEAASFTANWGPFVTAAQARVPLASLYVLEGNGNSMSFPLADNAATATSYSAAYSALIDQVEGASQFAILPTATYRQSPSVNVTGTTNQQNGTLPWDRDIIDPLVLARTPFFYDAASDTALADYYAPMLWARAGLTDGNHGDHQFSWLNFARTAARKLYGQTPISFCEWAVGQFGLERIAWWYDRCVEVVAILPDTSLKTALLTSLASPSGPQRININFNTAVPDSGRTENWNNAALTGATASLVDTAGGTTGIGIVMGAGWLATGTGSTTTYEEGNPYPNAVTVNSIYTSTATRTITLTGLNDAKLYTVRPIISSGQAQANRFTIGSTVIDVVNVLNGPVEFVDVAPVGGEIVLSVGVVPSQVNARIHGLRITEQA